MARGARAVPLLVALLTLVVLGGAAMAMMASNQVPASNAGQGEGDISGYTVSNIHYSFDGDPKVLDGVSFLISPVPNTVQVRFGNGTGITYWAGLGSGGFKCNMVNLGGGQASVNCGGIHEPIDAIDHLIVTAAQ